MIGTAAGYEFGALHDTTGTGAHLPAWHEAYVSAYWRRPQGMTVAGEFRTFSRFGQSANQILLGWDTPLTERWTAGLEAGGALNGGFIPHWRVGARTEFTFNEQFAANVSVSRLQFAAEPVWQVVPGARWQWHPQWSTHARLYVTHDAPRGAAANLGLAGAVGLTWDYSPLSAVTLTYARGEENATQLIKGLIGEKNFQSVGVDWKYGFSERLSVQPTYRYEQHNLFDLHAVGVNLQWRY